MAKEENSIIRYPFTRQLMFAKVMGDPVLCKEFIQRLFKGRKVADIVVHETGTVTTEATLIPGIYSRHVRLDVLFDDDTGWYNIEMQIAREDDLPKRGRYYSGAIDVAHMKPGQPYGDLKPSFVIFLCRFDYYGAGEPIYNFERIDKNLQLSCGDQSFIIVLNTICPEEKIPDGLRSLFQYINTETIETDDWFVERIHDRVLRYQSDKEVSHMATLEDEYLRQKTLAARKGREAGLTEGREAGLAEGREVGATDMLARLNKLNTMLLEAGRFDDLKKSLNDIQYQQSLLEEFNI